MRTPIVLLCAYLAITLAGCVSPIQPSRLEPPAQVLMQPPAKVPEVKAGDDLVQEHVKLRRSYLTETDKLSRLQRYIRTILKQ